MSVTLDPHSYEPLYRQLARLIREGITGGEYTPGEMLPSESRLAQMHGVGKDTVRDALAVLRGTGEVVTVRGVGTRVREEHEVDDEPIGAGVRVTARMPTDGERRDLGLPEGVPVLVVEQDGKAAVLPSNRKALVVE